MTKRNKPSIAMQSMAQNVLIQILSLLPTKSLHKFRCVSKSWNSLIIHVSSQRKALLPLSGLFITEKENLGEYVSIAPEPQCFGEGFQLRLRNLPFYSTCRLIHSCNGLLLFAPTKNDTTPFLYYVWNPTTMEYVALPEAPNRAYPTSRKSLCFLAYDPLQSPHYKVVRFTSHQKWSWSCIILEIYSSMTGRHLVGFDIEKRSFNLIELPNRRELGDDKCIGESREHLYYAFNVYERFELKVYKFVELNKWKLMHKINTKRDIHALYLHPIAFDPKLEVIYLSKENTVLSYHPRSDKLEKVQTISYEYIEWTKVFYVIPCLESINPPGGKFIDPHSLDNATGTQSPEFEVGSSSCGPQPDVAAVFDHDLQGASEPSFQGLVESHPLVPATNLDKQVVSSANPSSQESPNSTEETGKRNAGQSTLMKSLLVTGDTMIQVSKEYNTASITCGGIHLGTEGPTNSVSTRACDTSTVSPAELEGILSELKGTAMIPSLRQNAQQKSEDELTEEWADLCSKVLCITSYLAMVKSKVNRENLASRIDSLKQLNNSFDCSALIRCFDRFMDYIQAIEKNDLHIIESNLRTGYNSICRFHDDKMNKLFEKTTFVEAAARQVTNKIADLEHELNNARGCISDLQKRLAEEEAKVDQLHASLRAEKQKEVALSKEKAQIAAERAVLEVQGNVLEGYRVKISVEAKFTLEKMKNLVDQLAVSLSKFDLMSLPSRWEE